MEELTTENAKLLKNVVRALNTLTEESPLTEYQLLKYKVAGETEQWDGFARYAKNGRGMICVFRNDYPKKTVNAVLSDFPDGTFTLSDMITGEFIKTCSGKKLRSGLEIIWQEGTICRAIIIE